MPYPSPLDPRYCAGSERRPDSFDAELQWQICPDCDRPIVAKPSGRLFPHINVPGRRNDQVQWSLIHAGLNRRDRWAPAGAGERVYADAEG